MPRPRKWRRVCHIPRSCVFVPLSDDGEVQNQEVLMTVDEFETIRLIDYEGLNQEECANLMQIARTTVQGIYVKAREKLAEALVEGKKLVIRGGDFKFCEENKDFCPCCKKKNQKLIMEEIKEKPIISKEEKDMIIAIPVDECEKTSPCCISFGRTPYFAFYDVEKDSWEFKENTAADAPGGAGVKAAEIVLNGGANKLITIRCGENAAEVFDGELEIFKAIKGTAEENVKAFLNGELFILSETVKGIHSKWF